MKNKFLVMALIAGLVLACTPKKETLLRNYEKACEKGDAFAALRVISEMEKEFGKTDPDSVFTEEELERFEKASEILEEKTEEKLERFGNTLEQMNNLLDPLGDE